MYDFNSVRRLLPKIKRSAPSVLSFTVLTLSAESAHAGDIEQVFRNLVNAFVGRLLPVLALGYLGKHIFSHIQGDQNARNETVRVVVGIACLLSISGVWNFISQQSR